MICKQCGGECYGPCYDFCACKHCWNGWKQLSFQYRLWHRIRQIAWDLRKFVGTLPDPEDDRILVWECDPSVIPSVKVVWHFSGWHWTLDDVGDLEQGTLPGHDKSLYELAS